MINFLSGIYTHITNWAKTFQVKHFLTVILVGSLLLTTGLSERQSQAATHKVDNIIHQDDSQRPKTTGEWQAEAMETENAPGKRIQRIAGESAEALKEWGELYPEVAERTFEDDSNKRTK